MGNPYPSRSPAISIESYPAASRAQIECHLTAIVEHQRAIEVHKQDILKLRRELNQLSPINDRIPPELLSEIFALYAKSHAEDLLLRFRDSELSGDCLPYLWIKISHICHYWRCIALSSPFIWSYILVDRPKMAKEFLSRSQGASICVWQFGKNDYRLNAIFKAVLPQLPRMRDIRISSAIRPEDFPPEFLELRGLSAPSLISLALDSSPGTLLDVILGLDLPRLKHLELRKCNSRDWFTRPYPPSLRSLRVEIHSSINFFHMKTPASRLERLGCLETLHIICDSCPSVPMTSEFEEPVELLRLKNLVISSSRLGPHRMTQWLQLFRFPPNTQVQLSLKDALQKAPDFKELVDLCGSPVFRTFAVVVWFGKQYYSFCGWTESLSVRQLRLRQTPPLFALNCRIQKKDAMRFFMSLHPALHTLHTLEIVNDGEHGSELLTAICKSSQNIRNFGLDGELMDHLGPIYNHLPPSVQSLTIESKNWGPRLLGPLRPFLQTRVERGTKLQSLEVPSSVDSSNLASLRTLVGEVTQISTSTPPQDGPDFDDIFFHGASPY